MHKLLIAEDEWLMRIGIRSMIDWEAHGFRLVGEAANGREALDLALRVSPDLIITDIKMPVMDGLCLIREVSKTLTGCKFVILSNFDEIGYVKEALRLGASDYLVKSEMTPDGLIGLLADIRGKLQPAVGSDDGRRLPHVPHDDAESLTHRKERLFKDLISGLLGERDAEAMAEQLQLRVRSDRLAIAKLRIDRFEEVRKKYVEKDEKLLRFSVLNILGEVVPASRPIEIVALSSAEYLLIQSALTDNGKADRDGLGKLCGSILATMRDFMNLSFSAGISTVATGYRQVKDAYREADLALRQRFYRGAGQVIFHEDAAAESGRERIEAAADSERELAFRDILASKHAGRIVSHLDGFRSELDRLRADEKSIREAYIRLAEIVNTHIPAAWQRHPDDGPSPYEAVLSAETWADVHRIMTEYACRSVSDGLPGDQAGYAERAAELIHRYYAEDISLASVAGQINVHPSYLSRVFKQEKGENFVSYLTRIRIERAKSLLQGGSFRVYEIADKVGYHNYTYFSKLFKKVVGVSPEEYREG